MKLNFRKPKFLFRKINVRKVFRSILLIVFTSYILVGTLISLPQVDQYLEVEQYDLASKHDQYWKKSYILELKVSKDKKDAAIEVEKVKNVIHKRLNHFGVEEVKIVESDYKKSEAETSEVELNHDTKYLKVTVQSTKAQDATEVLISTRNFFRFYIPKDDVNFSDTNNQLAPYLVENYISTDFTRDSFRNILIKKLPTDSGTEAYFAIFKPWPHKTKAFNDMMKDQAGYLIGIKYDGFISPYRVSSEFFIDRVGSSTNTSQSSNNGIRPEFSIAVSGDKESAEVFDLLYNSGVIPVEFQMVNTEELETDRAEIDYMEVLLGVTVSVIAIIFYFSAKERRFSNKNFIFGISLLLVTITWISILKIYNIAIDLDILLYQSLILIGAGATLVYREKEDHIVDFIMLIAVIIMAVSTDGYAKLFAIGFLPLITALIVAIPLTKIYINNMNRLITK